MGWGWASFLGSEFWVEVGFREICSLGGFGINACFGFEKGRYVKGL